MSQTGVKKIIALSTVLAAGFVMVILAGALRNDWETLAVVATYCVAPLPNFICSRYSGGDDFMDSPSTAVVDFGRFLTGFFVAMGIALPIVLAHSTIIHQSSMVMSIVGGLLVYGTIVAFSWFFQEEQDF